MKKATEQKTNLIDESLTNNDESKNNNELIIKGPTNKHFIIVYETIYANTELNALQLQILIKLIGSAPTFKPSLRKLARILKVNRDTILLATNELQKMGFLEISKQGNKSTWTVYQIPKDINYKSLTMQTILKRLFDGDITIKDLIKAHKTKLIDDTIFIKVMDEYKKELDRIIHTNWLEQ